MVDLGNCNCVCLEVIFLSGGKGGATEARARDLGVKYCFVGAKNKPLVLSTVLEELSLSPERALFVGDDLNDLALKGHVALLIATADASRSLRVNADLVLHNLGGHGAVRELAERILQSKGLWSEISNEGWRDKND